MQSNLSRPEIQEYIRQHEHADERLLVLKHREIFGVDSSLIAEQIAARRKAKEKLPEYYATSNIIYPPVLNLEQSSSQSTATFKARVMREALGVRESELIVDLTGGFGVDTLHFAKVFAKVFYVEPNPSLVALAKHNHTQLGISNVDYFNTTAEEFLMTAGEKATAVYIDPSRRTVNSKRVFRLSECQPDVVQLQNTMFNMAEWSWIKASPLLDIQQALSELKFVQKVFVVAVHNEVKELLFAQRKIEPASPDITAVNIGQNRFSSFSFSLKEEREVTVTYSDPKTYLYEPFASVLKAGAFRSVAARHGVEKVHPNTHLYTSDSLVSEFPGRIFRIRSFVAANSRKISEHVPDGKANVVTRNHPLAAEALKQKLKLHDGGNLYLLAFTGTKQKFLCVAERVVL